MATDDFAHFFFVQEHFQRFTPPMHGRYQPVWYFLPILAFGIAPWVLPFFASLRGFSRREEAAFSPKLFLALWAIVVFVFFSVSGSKLPSYILPMFPALALLIGRWLAEVEPRRLLIVQAALASTVGIAVVVVGLQISALTFIRAEHAELANNYSPWLVLAGAALTTLSLASVVAAAYGHAARSVALLAAGSFLCTLIALAGHTTMSANYSIAQQARAIHPKAQVFAVDFYDHTLPWYLRRPVTMVRYKDELDVAIGWEPQKFIPDLPGFAKAWAAAPAASAVFSSSGFERAKAEANVPMEVVSQGPRYTIVRKP